MNPEGVVGMLTGIGFIVPTFFAWILILSELIFGVLVFVGYKTKYTAWYLAFIMLVAETTVVAPSGFWGSNSFFHLITIAGLATIALTGPGKWALSRD